MKYLVLFSGVIVIYFYTQILVGCTKDRIPAITDPTPDTTSTGQTIAEGFIVINEFVAKGSLNANEYGSTEDWIEIYNPNNFEAVLDSSKWFITDAGSSNPEKYELPYLTIPPKGFLVIWCDGMNVVDTQIHTNFNLSASGEHILIYYKKSSSEGIIIDNYDYGVHSNGGHSEGRYLDGENNWIFFSNPTIGASNN